MGWEVGINLKRQNSHHIVAFVEVEKLRSLNVGAYISHGSHFAAQTTQAISTLIELN